MGNAIAKKFDSPKDFSATAGHCGLYKIWQGKKQDTSEEISVWTFDKSDLAKRKPNPLNDKALQEQVLQLIRRDFTCLKECNCGGIIQIIEVISFSVGRHSLCSELSVGSRLLLFEVLILQNVLVRNSYVKLLQVTHNSTTKC